MSKNNNGSNPSSDFKENKFKEKESELKSGKAAKFPPSMNETPKQNNPQ